ncbi:M20 family peptidase [Solimonas marina]|uniref:M20/M25/M40 family metallo-hydrolase n=1 Tax=Solimonas marina TaxID=2714601 RepID=A0A970B7C5_9GAMM|nr:M20 family peptidase [Solimonas marina]NKF21069.1 M20/M25/M40 family metallo-hydrolase [Solimonas marina]
MRKLGLGMLVLALGLAVVLGVRVVGVGHAVPRAAPVSIEVDADAMAAHLAAAVRIATVSPTDADPNDQAFDDLAALLKTQYPRVDATLAHETVGKHGLLYRWDGSDPKLPPVLLLAHQDVVPVEQAALSRWHHAPFSGDIADGYIWGRGTLDDKGSLIGQFEAVEALLAQGYQPRRTVYFAYGFDEEIGGLEGAVKIAALLKQRGIHALYGLDEGGAVTHGVIAGVDVPVASIMTAEKGYVSFDLRVKGAGGHSSMPPPQTAIGQLARAVARLEAHQMPARFTPEVAGMLDSIAPELPFGERLAVANRWLFGPLLLREFAKAPVTNALIRTTTAPTLFNAGVKDNVLPGEASAVVNFRLLPGDSIAALRQHIVDVIDDPGVEVKSEAEFADEASPSGDTRGPGYAVIKRSIEQTAPQAVVTPGLVVGATDLRHYQDVIGARYNFLPGQLEAEDLERIHGVDERIAVAQFANVVRFYRQFLRNATSG